MVFGPTRIIYGVAYVWFAAFAEFYEPVMARGTPNGIAGVLWVYAKAPWQMHWHKLRNIIPVNTTHQINK